MKNNKFALILAALLVSSSVAVGVFAEEPVVIVPNPNAVTVDTGNASGAENVAETAAEIKFSDIADDAVYKDAVYKLVNNGVLNGYPNGTFLPEGNLTRAEMCKMINLVFGYTDTEGVEMFPDMVAGEWYVPYILAARKAGYVNGDDTGLFRPDDNISREEVCAILCRIIKPYDLPLEVAVSDSVSEWAKPYVELILKNQLMPLEEGNTFRATLPIRRFELAVAVAPYSNTKVEAVKCTVTFKDGEETTSAEVEIGKAMAELPQGKHAPEGYQFAGWSMDEKAAEAEEITLIDNQYVFTENVTLYAVYEKKTFNIRFMIDNTIVVTSQDVKFGDTVTVPNAPSKSGYTFKGWTLDGKTVVDFEKYTATESVIFNALFVKTETAGGSTGGSTGGGTGGSTGGGTGGSTGGNTGGNTGDNTGKDDGKKDDDKKDEGEPDDGKKDDNTGDDGKVTITDTVTFVVDGVTVSTQKVERGKFAKLPTAPKRDGAEFLYWSLSENGEEVEVESYEIGGEVTFYAVFKIEEKNPNDPVVIAELEKGIEQLAAVRLSVKEQSKIRSNVLKTMKAVLQDAYDGIFIDSDYIQTAYKDEVDTAEKQFKALSDTDQSDFITKIRAGVDDRTFDILTDYFLDEETKNKYLGDK